MRGFTFHKLSRCVTLYPNASQLGADAGPRSYSGPPMDNAKHENGRCAIRGSCGNLFTEIPCVDNGLAEEVRLYIRPSRNWLIPGRVTVSHPHLTAPCSRKYVVPDLLKDPCAAPRSRSGQCKTSSSRHTRSSPRVLRVAITSVTSFASSLARQIKVLLSMSLGSKGTQTVQLSNRSTSWFRSVMAQVSTTAVPRCSLAL